MNIATKHPTIALTSCDSSQIHAHGHDAATNTLALQFKGKGGPGSVYHYANFTEADYAAFLTAKSKGLHFGANIKSRPDKHPHTKVWDHKTKAAA